MKKEVNKSLIPLITTASVAFFLFLTLMILVLCGYNLKIDKFNVVVAENRTKFLTEFFKIFTHLGSFYTLAGLMLVGAILIWFVLKDKRTSVFYAVTFTCACIISAIVKVIVKRTRPEHLMIIEQSGFSFPSGHSIMIFAFFALAVHFVCKFLKNKTLKISLVLLFSAIIGLIGFSRIYLGVHYLTDVIAGYLISYVVVAGFVVVYNSNCFKFLKDKK